LGTKKRREEIRDDPTIISHLADFVKRSYKLLITKGFFLSILSLSGGPRILW